MSVVNVRSGEQYDVFVGRGSKWGNPFSHNPRSAAKRIVATREEAIARHRAWLWGKIRTGQVSLEELAELESKSLGCYCAPKECHGHTLERAAVWAKGELAKREAGA